MTLYILWKKKMGGSLAQTARTKDEPVPSGAGDDRTRMRGADFIRCSLEATPVSPRKPTPVTNRN